MKLSSEKVITLQACGAISRFEKALDSSKDFHLLVKKNMLMANSKEGLEELMATAEELVAGYNDLPESTRKGIPYQLSILTAAKTIFRIKLEKSPNEPVYSPEIFKDGLEHSVDICKNAAGRLVSSTKRETVISYAALEHHNLSVEDLAATIQSFLPDKIQGKVQITVLQRDPQMPLYMERRNYYKKQIYVVHPNLPIVKVSLV